jgi:uncharacterized protein (DUF1499 family)
MRWDWVAWGIMGTGLLVAGSFAYRSWRSRKNPPELGLLKGQLRPCSDKPNCVSSQETRTDHRVEAWPFKGNRAKAMVDIKSALGILPRAQIQSEQDNYLHAIDVSALFRFIDDVEFLIDESAGVVHIRSASREGYSDLGVNRKRVERLRQAFEAKQK